MSVGITASSYINSLSGIAQESSGIWTGTSTPISLGLPSTGSSTLLLFVAANVTVTTPSGWTLRRSQVNNMGHYLYTREGDASTSWTLSTGNGEGTWYMCEIVNGTYESATSSDNISSGTNYSTPAITPSLGSKVLFASIASLTGSSVVRTVSGWTNGFSESSDICQPIGSYPMQGIANRFVVASGSDSYSTTTTYSAASNGRSAIICSLIINVSGDTTAPSIPTNLSASVIGSTQVNLSWTASTDNVAVDHYEIYRYGVSVGTSSTTSFSDSSLTASTTYEYTVRALDAAGNSSADSDVVSATTGSGVTPINVIANPSAFGWPDASNTGPASGTVFTVVPNDLTSGTGWLYEPSFDRVRVTGDNATLQALDIRCPVVIDAADVLIEDCIIACDGGLAGDDSVDVIALRNRPVDGFLCERPTIRRCRINGMASNDHTIRARRCVSDNYGSTPGVVIEYCDMSGTGNHVTVPYECIVRHNYCHSLGHRYSDHHSGLSAPGGALSLYWYHNTLALQNTPTDADIYPSDPDAGGGLSSCTSIAADFAHAQNVTVEANVIANTDYSYASSGGNHGGAYNPANPSTNIKFINNRYALAPNAYGPIYAFDPNSTDNQWTGNINDSDNTPISA